jgi:hypothetical protein
VNVVVNGIIGKVEWAGFRKSRGDEGPRVLMRYQVPYASGDNFADGVMGGISSAGGTVRYNPRQNCPTNPRLYALHADIEYFAEQNDTTGPYAGGTVVLPGFDTATVAVEYGNLTWPQITSDDPGGEQSFPNDDIPGEPYVFAECEIDMATELITVANAGLTFATSPNIPLDAPIVVRQAVSTWRITRHQFPNLPYKQVMAMLGQLNQSTFLGQTQGLVLFDDARTKQVMTSDGTKCQGFELVFKVKTLDWNRFIRPDKMIWDTVADGSGNNPYTYTDLKPLLK